MMRFDKLKQKLVIQTQMKMFSRMKIDDSIDFRLYQYMLNDFHKIWVMNTVKKAVRQNNLNSRSWY